MSTSDRGGCARWPRQYLRLIAARPRREWPAALEQVPAEFRPWVRHYLKTIVALGQHEILYPPPHRESAPCSTKPAPKP